MDDKIIDMNDFRQAAAEATDEQKMQNYNIFLEGQEAAINVTGFVVVYPGILCVMAGPPGDLDFQFVAPLEQVRYTICLGPVNKLSS